MKKKRNYEWILKHVFDSADTCIGPDMEIVCPNDDCAHVFCLDNEEFVLDVPFKCKRCGESREYYLHDDDSDNIYCRCFATIIAKKILKFCMRIRICRNCFTPHYTRHCIIDEACCKTTRKWRFYLPHVYECYNGVFPLPPPGSAVIEPMKKGC